MSTQVQDAKAGIITDEMKFVANKENVSVQVIKDGVAKGKIVILKNNKRIDSTPTAVGEGLKIKVCAPLNKHNRNASLDGELDKLRIIQNAGADVVIDYSSNKLIDETREAILSNSKLPVGSNPILQAGVEFLETNSDIALLTKFDILSTIERHCSDGVDFICLQAGFTQALLKQYEVQNRISKKLSIPATILACWMKATGLENPLYQYFDDILKIVKPYDVTLVLSNCLSSINTFDASDALEVSEIIVLSELIKKARENDVQVMVEGIDMASLNKIPMMVQNIKQLTDFAPLFLTSALACDTAIGIDNITSAIGSALACYQGANMINAVCAFDRVGVLKATQLKDAIMSAKIAAHCADLACGHIDTTKQNYKMAFAISNSDSKKQMENCLDKSILDKVKTSKNASLGVYIDELYNKYFK